MRNRTNIVAVLAMLVVATVASSADARLKAEQIPLFKWRARAVSVQGEPAADNQNFSFRFDRVKDQSASTQGDAWSDWLPFTREHAVIYTGEHAYPNTYMRSFPLITKLAIGGVKDPTVVEVQVQFEGQNDIHNLRGELFGPLLGVLITMDDGTPTAQSMAEYNRKYWAALADVNIPEDHRPKLFPIVDRFIGGDSDNLAWREGIDGLARAGFSAIMLPPDARYKQMAEHAGHTRTAWAVYNPPGYAFDYEFKTQDDVDAAVEAWASKQADPFLKIGYEPDQMAMYAMSDEPGWYYPGMLDKLKTSERGMARFHQYLKDQGLTPADVGHESWDSVMPIGRWDARESLEARRLFYWTMRFFPWDSSRHFAVSAKALEAKFAPMTPIFTNWNFFAGRSYVPGPVANNGAKTDPNAAMGGHDWLEFGRMRGGTMLWTEDWFGDGKAYQWSFYNAKMRAGARKGNIEFGGYVIPRTAGQREGGITQKIVSIVGQGGKGVKYFVFGPEYNFPSNCYSENIKVLPQMAEAHRMVGVAEELLYPGRMPQEKVAILVPRSAQMWDDTATEIPRTIYDATNTNLNGRTVDYMAEVFNLYLALQHANIPATFVEERDLSPQGLAGIKALYVTAPNLPNEYAKGLAAWVKRGGSLVTVAGVGQADRYNDATTTLADALGIHELQRDRVIIADADKLPASANVKVGDKKVQAFAGRSWIEKHSGDTIATFGKNDPAAVTQVVGKGRVTHFAFMPGTSYWRTKTGDTDGLPTGFSAALRDLIARPALDAAGEPPVISGTPLVEASLLTSEKGAVVTVLNWTGAPIDRYTFDVALDFKPSSVETVLHGKLKTEEVDGRVRVTLPIDEADFIMLRR